MTTLARYRKSLLAIVGALATWALSTFPDNLDVQRYGGLAVAVVTALSVYVVANRASSGDTAPGGTSEGGTASPVGTGDSYPADGPSGLMDGA